MKRKNSIVKKTMAMAIFFLAPLSLQQGESFLSKLFGGHKKQSSPVKKSKKITRKKRLSKRKIKSSNSLKRRVRYKRNKRRKSQTIPHSKDINLSTPSSSLSITSEEKIQQLTKDVQKLTADLQASLLSYKTLEEKMSTLLQENFTKEKNSINHFVDEKLEELTKNNADTMNTLSKNLRDQLEGSLEFFQKLNSLPEELLKVKEEYRKSIEEEVFFHKESILEQSLESPKNHNNREEGFNSEEEDLQSINLEQERRDDSMVKNDAQVKIENRGEDNENIQAQILKEEIRQREENEEENQVIKEEINNEFESRGEDNENIQAQILKEEIRQGEEKEEEEQQAKEEVNLSNREEKEEEKKANKPKKKKKSKK